MSHGLPVPYNSGLHSSVFKTNFLKNTTKKLKIVVVLGTKNDPRGRSPTVNSIAEITPGYLEYLNMLG